MGSTHIDYKLLFSENGSIQNLFYSFYSSGKKVVYFGESGKNGYSRGRKHLEDFKSGMTSHCMTIHMKVHHPNLPRSASYFKMIPVKSFRSPLERQVSEALSINNAEVDLVMNSGSEWRCGRLPRAAVTRPLT